MVGPSTGRHHRLTSALGRTRADPEVAHAPDTTMGASAAGGSGASDATGGARGATARAAWLTVTGELDLATAASSTTNCGATGPSRRCSCSTSALTGTEHVLETVTSGPPDGLEAMNPRRAAHRSRTRTRPRPDRLRTRRFSRGRCG